MKTAIAYYRYSSAMQDENSIKAQRDAVQKYAAREGINIIREFIDREKSGKTDDRPQFMEIISLLKRGEIKVDYVLWHKFDRFARNKTDAAIYRREIRRAGAKPIAVDQPLDPETRPEDVIMEGLLDAMAEYYSLNLAREIMKGLKVNAQECKFNGGWPPYGFSVQDGKYVINEAEAPAIRLMFEMTDQRRSYQDICDALTQRGYLTRKGKPFTKTSIHDILRNPKYAGIYAFNRASSRGIDGKRNWRKPKDKEEIVCIPGGIPAIVSRELFERVQKILDERKHNSPREKEKGVLYILTGKTFCGYCGSPVVGTSSTRVKGGRPYRYYMCCDKQRKRKNSNCISTRWYKEETESAVLGEIKHVLGDTDALAEYFYNLYLERNKKKDSQTETIKKEIQTLTDKINRLLDLVENGTGDLSAASERISQYTARKKDLEFQLQTANDNYVFSKRDFNGYLSHIAETIAGNPDPYHARKLIETWVEKIILYPDNRVEVMLKFNLSPPPGGAYNPGAEGAYLTYTHRFKL